MNSKNLSAEIVKKQKEQAELALKSRIQIAKSVIKGHEPLNIYHFQQAIEEIKHFRILSRQIKQSFNDLDLLISTTYLDSQVVKEITSQFKFKLEHSKEFIESKYIIKNFEDMSLDEMSNLSLNIHNKWIMKVLPPITFEDIKRGNNYLNEKKADMGFSANAESILQTVEGIDLKSSNLFSNFLFDLFEKVKKIASKRKLIQWEEIIEPTLPFGEKSRIAQGLSHLSYQNKLWLIRKNDGDFFQINY